MSSHLSAEGRWTCLENVGHKVGTEGEAIIGGVILPWPLPDSWPRWSEQLPPLHFFDSTFMPYLCLKMMVPASHGLIIYLPPLSQPLAFLLLVDPLRYFVTTTGQVCILLFLFNSILCNFSWDFFLWLVWKYTFFSQCLRIFLAVFLLMILLFLLLISSCSEESYDMLLVISDVLMSIRWSRLWSPLESVSYARSRNAHSFVSEPVLMSVILTWSCCWGQWFPWWMTPCLSLSDRGMCPSIILTVLSDFPSIVWSSAVR